MRYFFDIDGTICTDKNGKYEKAMPFPERIAKLNELYDKGNTIILYTGRGVGTGIDCRELTEHQLKCWNVKYHKLLMTKEPFEVLIDDKAINATTFFDE